MCYGLSDQQARSFVYDFDLANDKTFPQSWNTNKCAGKEWILDFRGRHPKLSLNTLEVTSLGRGTSFNKYNVSLFYNNLKDLLQKHSFQSSQIYNCDETGATIVYKPRKIIASTGQKQSK